MDSGIKGLSMHIATVDLEMRTITVSGHASKMSVEHECVWL